MSELLGIIRPMNPYAVLGIAPTATPEEIRRAHRQRIRVAHPDCGGNNSRAAYINAARDAAIARRGWISGVAAPESRKSPDCSGEKFTPEHHQSPPVVRSSPTLSTSPAPGFQVNLTASRVVSGIVAGYLLLLGFAVVGWVIAALAG